MLATAVTAVWLLTTAATRPVDVVVSRAVEVGPAEAAVVSESLARALRGQGLTVPEVQDSAARLKALGSPRSESCNAERSCVARLGALLQSQLVVSLDLGKVSGQLVVAVEALNPADGLLVAQHAGSAGSGAGQPKALELLFGEFARRVRPKVSDVPAPEPVAMLPHASGEQPRSLATPPPPEPPVSATASGRPTAFLVTAIGGGVTAAIALTSLTVGLVARRQYDAARFDSPFGMASHLTQPEAGQLAATANAGFTAALVVGAVAGALLTTSLVWWLGLRD